MNYTPTQGNCATFFATHSTEKAVVLRAHFSRLPMGLPNTWITKLCLNWFWYWSTYSCKNSELIFRVFQRYFSRVYVKFLNFLWTEHDSFPLDAWTHIRYILGIRNGIQGTKKHKSLWIRIRNKVHEVLIKKVLDLAFKLSFKNLLPYLVVLVPSMLVGFPISFCHFPMSRLCYNLSHSSQ